MAHRGNKETAPPGQYAFQFGEQTVVHDIMVGRENGSQIAALLRNDPLWKTVPDKHAALFIDEQNDAWMTMHPHTFLIESKNAGTTPFGLKKTEGVAFITHPLEASEHLSNRMKFLTGLLAKEGTLVIIEQMSDDQDLQWRKDILREHSLVKADVSLRDGYIRWHARRKKDIVREPTDLIANYAQSPEYWRNVYFPLGFANVLTEYAARGYEVTNFEIIEKRLRESTYARMDLDALKKGLGVDILDKRCGTCVTRVEINGVLKPILICNNTSAHESSLSNAILRHDINIHDHVLRVRKATKLDDIPHERETLNEVCPDCFGNIYQTAQELGQSPVGRLFYVTRCCPMGDISEELIGVVEK